jgi:hypothetical protein
MKKSFIIFSLLFIGCDPMFDNHSNDLYLNSDPCPYLYMRCQADPYFNFKDKKLIVLLQDAKTIEEKKLEYLIFEQLKYNGFTITNRTDINANYNNVLSLFFNIYQDDGSYNVNSYIPMATYSNGNYWEFGNTNQVYYNGSHLSKIGISM